MNGLSKSVLDYKKTDKCIYPLSDVFELLDVFEFHEDYEKMESGYSWNLHIAELEDSLYTNIYLAVLENHKVAGMVNALYSRDSAVLDITNINTKNKYKGIGLGKSRISDLIKIAKYIGPAPKKVRLKGYVKPEGKSFFSYLGFKLTDDIWEIEYNHLMKRLE